MHSRKEPSLELTQSEKDIILKHFPKGICSFDLEMTGLSPLFDKIIEIAAIKLNPDGEISYFHTLINPLVTIPEYTIKYHGLTNNDLRDCPTLKNPLREFVQFFDNTPLLAHNAKFDISFIVKGIHEYNFPISLSDVYDSCRFARAVYKKAKSPPCNFSLGELAKFYEFDFSHHFALDDAIAALKIFAKALLYLSSQTDEFNLKGMGFLFKLNSFKRAENYILPKNLACLKDVLQKQQKITIKYHGNSSKGHREIKPISLLPLPNGLVLYALCVESNINKYFLTKKIKDIKL